MNQIIVRKKNPAFKVQELHSVALNRQAYLKNAMRMLTMMMYWKNMYTAWRNGVRKAAGGHGSPLSHTATHKYAQIYIFTVQVVRPPLVEVIRPHLTLESVVLCTRRECCANTR